MDYRTCPNLVRLFFDQAAVFGDSPFLWAKTEGAWKSLSWAEVARQVRRLAAGLTSLGVTAGDRVALVAENRPEWIVADLAIMSAGAITVPAYTTSTVDDYRHVFANVGARGVIASTQALVERSLAAAQLVPGCQFLIGMEPPHFMQDVGLRIESWSDLVVAEPRVARDLVAQDGGNIADETAARLTRADLACVMHTSGTGGLPRGVMLTHGALLSNCLGAHDLLLQLGLEDEVFLSFLPLSHAYEHTAGLYFPVSIGAQIYFAEGVEQLAANLLEVQPTIMTAVPRLYETLHRRILAGVERQGGLAAKLFFATLRLGQKRYRQDGRLGAIDSLVDAVLERLVRNKVRARFGGRLKAFVSGGAALNPDIGLFFTALGVLLLQGYGQTETAPVVACNPPNRVKLDTVGPPVIDVAVKIAEDGEILVRGELVMRGYWNDEAATREAIRDGWLHTGDVGLLDGDGYLKITDRKRDFIKNSGGEMIAPARVEGVLVLEREIAQAMVYGDRHPYLVAVIVPHADFAAGWAKAHGGPANLEALAGSKPFHAAIDEAVQRANAKLPAIERIRRFILARAPFSVDNEQMTPTLKVKRHMVRNVYGTELEALYQGR